MAFQLPESLEGLNTAELDELIAAARTELSALAIGEESSDDDLAAAEAIVDAMAAIATQSEAVATADAERAERVARLSEAAQEPEAPVAEEAPAEEAPVEEAPVAELVEAAVETITPDEVIDPTPTEEKDAVTASSNPVERAASNALPVDYAPSESRVTLTAAAGVPGAAVNQPVENLDGVVDLISNQIKAMPKHNLATKQGGVRQRFSTIQVHRDPGDAELIQGATGNDWDLVERAADERRLPGGSLTAAALDPNVSGPAWCAPSETMYDLCEVEDVTGMLDLPEFTVNRGGIRYTKGPKWDDIYSDPNRNFYLENTGTTDTNGQKVDALDLKDANGGDIAAVAPDTQPKKPCIMVDCYPWYEERLDADGLCVKSPILLEVTYPELIKRFTEMVLVAHKHDVNKRRIQKIRAQALADAGGAALTMEAFGNSGATPAFTAANGRTVFNLAAIEFQAMGLRYKYRKPVNSTIEVIAPNWLRDVIRMDLAMENGGDRNVSDAQVNGWFTSRNMRVQWVYDYQDIDVDQDGTVNFPNDGSARPAAWSAGAPTTVELIMYPAGTWSAGVSDVFSIDAVYDAASLADNVYTAMFMEEAELLVQRCTESTIVNVPLCISGQGVLDALADCLTQV